MLLSKVNTNVNLDQRQDVDQAMKLYESDHVRGQQTAEDNLNADDKVEHEVQKCGDDDTRSKLQLVSIYIRRHAAHFKSTMMLRQTSTCTTTLRHSLRIAMMS